jgi:hypothetical protein
MTFRQVCTVHNNQVVITLPTGFAQHKMVTVVVDDATDERAQKMALMQNAVNDPLFLADVKCVQSDFDAFEHDNL